MEERGQEQVQLCKENPGNPHHRHPISKVSPSLDKSLTFKSIYLNVAPPLIGFLSVTAKTVINAMLDHVTFFLYSSVFKGDTTA